MQRTSNSGAWTHLKTHGILNSTTAAKQEQKEKEAAEVEAEAATGF